MSTALVRPTVEGFRTEVSIARLRLAQVALIGAMDANRDLLMDEKWQNALADVNRMISEATPREAERQLALFTKEAKAA